ncbi:MAG: DUF1289 domain-containing protein [Steroidobacteraceae bacterium]
MESLGPPSPCINVCVLDSARRCTGCGRTIDEIAGWGRMNANQRWAVIARLEAERATARTTAGSPATR